MGLCTILYYFGVVARLQQSLLFIYTAHANPRRAYVIRPGWYCTVVSCVWSVDDDGGWCLLFVALG